MQHNSNVRIIFFCQRCNREHDRTHEAMIDVGVKCDYCNGYVVSPSGRSVLQIRITAGCYLINGDTKTAWIGARNKAEAMDFFVEHIETGYNRITKLSNEELEDTTFTFDPDQTGNPEDYVILSAKELVTFDEKLPKAYYLIDNDDLERALRKKQEGES